MICSMQLIPSNPVMLSVCLCFTSTIAVGNSMRLLFTFRDAFVDSISFARVKCILTKRSIYRAIHYAMGLYKMLHTAAMTT